MKRKNQREKELFYYIKEKAGIIKDDKITPAGVNLIAIVMVDLCMQAVNCIIKEIDKEEEQKK